jgi:hypothetical protein
MRAVEKVQMTKTEDIRAIAEKILLGDGAVNISYVEMLALMENGALKRALQEVIIENNLEGYEELLEDS